MIYRFLSSFLLFAFLFAGAFRVQAQTFAYYGCITDEAGEAVIGASVMVKNKMQGTISDVEGCFRIDLRDSLPVTLVVSFTGYKPLETTAEAGKPLLLTMALSAAMLDEIVVVGAATEHRTARSHAMMTMTTRDGERGRRRDAAPAPAKRSAEAMPPPSPSAYAYEAAPSTEPFDDRRGPGGAQAGQAAGQLTAGEINDFNKWELWKDISTEDLAEYRSSWLMNAEHRFVLQVTNEAGLPAVNIPVVLYGTDQKPIWEARTDNTGKAECWAHFWVDPQAATAAAGYRLVALYKGKEYPAATAKMFQDGINFVKVPAPCAELPMVDIAFVVDATGSMADEIQYLQAELLDVVLRVKDSLGGANLQLGSVFYRDHGDDYLTRTQPLSSDLPQAMEFVRNQYADGGGDFPEALDEALAEAIQKLGWRTEATTRLLFLVLDAPPHTSPEHIQKIQQATRQAAALGIRIIPITCSGIDKSTEYLMRVMALGSNGLYTFLTNHSGIGNAHIEPSTDTYQVEKLNDLLVRVINGFSRLGSCEAPVQPLATTEPAVVHPASQPDSLQTGQGLSWKYFPNPTRGPVSVADLGSFSEATLYLSDANGKLLERHKITTESLNLDLSNYPAGSYLLIVERGDTRSSGRLIRIED